MDVLRVCTVIACGAEALPHRLSGLRAARAHVAVALLGAFLPLSTACSGSRTESKSAESPAIDVTVAAVTAADLPQVYEAGGVVRARTTAAITSRLLAPVTVVLVAPGETVHEGQVLVRLDDRDLSAQQRRAVSGRQAAVQAGRGAASERASAAADLALASARHKRIVMLHDRRSATDDELDEAVAALRAAESRLAGAEARIAESDAGLSAAAAGADAATVGASWAVIRAPFDGVITEKLVEPGNMASPGMPLLRMEQSGALRLDVRLDESRAGAFHSGQEVEVRFDPGVARVNADVHAAGSNVMGAGREVEAAHQSRRNDVGVRGRVGEIARAAEAGAHAYLVKIELPADLPVASGTYAHARFAGPARRVLAVPRAAVVRHGQLTSVFVVDSDHARLRLVSTGDELLSPGGTDLVEVLAGLGDGERVVTNPSPALRDSVRVRAVAGPHATAAPAAEAR